MPAIFTYYFLSRQMSKSLSPTPIIRLVSAHLAPAARRPAGLRRRRGVRAAAAADRFARHWAAGARASDSITDSSCFVCVCLFLVLVTLREEHVWPLAIVFSL